MKPAMFFVNNEKRSGAAQPRIAELVEVQSRVETIPLGTRITAQVMNKAGLMVTSDQGAFVRYPVLEITEGRRASHAVQQCSRSIAQELAPMLNTLRTAREDWNSLAWPIGYGLLFFCAGFTAFRSLVHQNTPTGFLVYAPAAVPFLRFSLVHCGDERGVIVGIGQTLANSVPLWRTLTSRDGRLSFNTLEGDGRFIPHGRTFEALMELSSVRTERVENQLIVYTEFPLTELQEITDLCDHYVPSVAKVIKNHSSTLTETLQHCYNSRPPEWKPVKFADYADMAFHVLAHEVASIWVEDELLPRQGE